MMHLYCYFCNVWGHKHEDCFTTTNAKWEASMHKNCAKANEQKTILVDGYGFTLQPRKMPSNRDGHYPGGKGQGGQFTPWTADQLALRLKNLEEGNVKFEAHIKTITDQYPDIAPNGGA